MARVKTALFVALLVVREAVGRVVGPLVVLAGRAGSFLAVMAVLLTVSAFDRLETLWARARSFR